MTEPTGWRLNDGFYVVNARLCPTTGRYLKPGEICDHGEREVKHDKEAQRD